MKSGLFLAAFAVMLLGLGGGRCAALAPAALSPVIDLSSHEGPLSRFDAKEAFAPLALPGPVNRYRAGDGSPGPDYWQNRADYAISVRLDPASKVLSGAEVITYTNNSPDRLASLWLQLDQNTYRRDARAAIAREWRSSQFTEGYSIEDVAVESGGSWSQARFVVTDTRLQIQLVHAIEPKGGHLKIKIAYHFTVPGVFGGRTAWVDTKNGPIFDIAQWYPRMAVYDDVRGWDTLPYIAQEFYLEYGDFDYAVTAPANMIVIGTGDLINPEQVLTPEQRRRLTIAGASDATVTIRSPQEVLAPAGVTGERTWRYRMKNTRDVAFSASPAFVWDAARINLSGGRTALAESVYPVESAGSAAWGRATEYMKDSVERFSKRWFTYPYPTAIGVAGGASGMEYPGMAFNGIKDEGKALFWITAHEIGHTWFPMVVGFDERRDAWMDEGFNTFIDTFESDEFQGGVYGPKRDSEFAPGPGEPADQIVHVLKDPDAPPILTRADSVIEKYRHPVTYFKSALGLVLLREVILGPERFDPAFRKFIADWAFKHPKPSDFFRAMESEGGEDLSWWWRGWYLNNWSLDLAVLNVTYVTDDPAKGANVSIQTLDKLVLPAVLEIRYVTGPDVRVNVPVEAWMHSSKVVVRLPGGAAIKEVIVDPDHRLPDSDRTNNTFVVGSRGPL